MISKKAQIGKVMTWFVAFIIIVFIILLFVATSLIFADRNKVLIPSDSSEILRNQIELNNFLNKPVQIESEKMLIKDLIVKSKEDAKYSSKLDEEADLFVKNLNSKCYVLNLNNKMHADTSKSGNLYAIRDTMGYYNILLDTKGAKMILFSGEGKSAKKIEIKFYSGDC